MCRIRCRVCVEYVSLTVVYVPYRCRICAERGTALGLGHGRLSPRRPSLSVTVLYMPYLLSYMFRICVLDCRICSVLSVVYVSNMCLIHCQICIRCRTRRCSGTPPQPHQPSPSLRGFGLKPSKPQSLKILKPSSPQALHPSTPPPLHPSTPPPLRPSNPEPSRLNPKSTPFSQTLNS